MKRTGMIALAIAAIVALPAHAAVSQKKAAQLGHELTPVGANPNGNAAGTISKWVGGSFFTEQEKQYTHEDVMRLWKHNPDKLNYIKVHGGAITKPKFVITADNYMQYADHLSAGQKAMFAQYDDYKMIVYPTVRDAFFPEAIYEATEKNATRATLEGTDGISGEKLGFPFPIPTNGAQAIWNAKLKYRGSAVTRYNNQAVVDEDGGYEITKLIEDVRFEYANLDKSERDENVILQYLSRTISPPRVTGQITLEIGRAHV